MQMGDCVGLTTELIAARPLHGSSDAEWVQLPHHLQRGRQFAVRSTSSVKTTWSDDDDDDPLHVLSMDISILSIT